MADNLVNVSFIETIFNSPIAMSKILTNYSQYDKIFSSEILLEKLRESKIAMNIILQLENLKPLLNEYPLLLNSLREYLNDLNEDVVITSNIYTQLTEPILKDGLWINMPTPENPVEFKAFRENILSYTESTSPIIADTAMYHPIYHQYTNRIYYTPQANGGLLKYYSMDTNTHESTDITLDSTYCGDSVVISKDEILLLYRTTSTTTTSNLSYRIYNIKTNTLGSTVTVPYRYMRSTINDNTPVFYSKGYLCFVGMSSDITPVTDNTVDSTTVDVYRYKLSNGSMTSTYSSNIKHDEKTSFTSTYGMSRVCPIGLIGDKFYILRGTGYMSGDSTIFDISLYSYDTTLIGSQNAVLCKTFTNTTTGLTITTASTMVVNSNALKTVEFLNKIYCINTNFTPVDFWLLYENLIDGLSNNRPSDFKTISSSIKNNTSNTVYTFNTSYLPSKTFQYSPSPLYPETGIASTYGSKNSVTISKNSNICLDDVNFIEYGVLKEADVYYGNGTEWVGNGDSSGWVSILANSSTTEIKGYLSDSVSREEIIQSTPALVSISSNSTVMNWVANEPTVFEALLDNGTAIDTLMEITTPTSAFMTTEHSLNELLDYGDYKYKFVDIARFRNYIKSSNVTESLLFSSETFINSCLRSVSSMQKIISDSSILVKSLAYDAFIKSSSVLNLIFGDATLSDYIVNNVTARNFAFSDTTLFNKILTISAIRTRIAANSAAVTYITNDSSLAYKFLINTTTCDALIASTTALGILSKSQTVIDLFVTYNSIMNYIISKNKFSSFIRSTVGYTTLLNNANCLNIIVNSSSVMSSICSSSIVFNYIAGDESLYNTILTTTTSATVMLKTSSSISALSINYPDKLNTIMTTTTYFNLIDRNSFVSNNDFATALFTNTSYGSAWLTKILADTTFSTELGGIYSEIIAICLLEVDSNGISVWDSQFINIVKNKNAALAMVDAWGYELAQSPYGLNRFIKYRNTAVNPKMINSFMNYCGGSDLEQWAIDYPSLFSIGTISTLGLSAFSVTSAKVGVEVSGPSKSGSSTSIFIYGDPAFTNIDNRYKSLYITVLDNESSYLTMDSSSYNDFRAVGYIPDAGSTMIRIHYNNSYLSAVYYNFRSSLYATEIFASTPIHVPYRLLTVK